MSSRLIFALFAAGMLCSMVFAAPVEPVRTLSVPHASGPISIDGTRDASYSSLQSTDFIHPDMLDNYDGPSDYTAQFALCWDNDYLYIYSEIVDDVEHDYQWDTGDPWMFDIFDVFLQLDTNTLTTTTGDELATQLRICRGLDSVETAGRAPRSEYLYYMESAASNGWIAEVGIPWTAVLAEGMQPEDILNYVNSPIGFEYHGSDSDGSGDTGARDFMTAWDLDGQDGTEDLAWNNTSVFGYIDLLNSGVSVPIANAGPDQTVSEGELVTLNGNGSSDPEGDALTYTWTAPSGISLSDIHAVNPTFIAPAAAQTSYYIFGLTVSDGATTSSSDYVRITVVHNNQAPVANAGPDQTVTEREIVMLDGSHSSDLESSSVSSYSWQALQDVNMIYASTPNPILVAPDVYADSSFQFVLTVSDGSLISEPDTMNLWVRSAFDEYDTLLIYDTVYMVDVVYNTILITVVNDGYEVTAHEIDGALHVNLFPNPADQFINISSEMLIDKVQILNAQGAVVMEEIVDDLNAQLNVGSMTAGNYILRISCESGIITKQLVLE